MERDGLGVNPHQDQFAVGAGFEQPEAAALGDPLTSKTTAAPSHRFLKLQIALPGAVLAGDETPIGT